MKSFNNRECSAQYVLKIKKLYKQQSNNPNIIQQYNAILNDTNIAMVLHLITIIEKRYYLILHYVIKMVENLVHV